MREIFLKIWRGRWVIAISILIAVVLAAMLISRFEPRYSTSATVMFGIERANIADLNEILVSPEFDQDTLENEVQVLRSSNLINRVVDELALDENPEFNPYLIEPEPGLVDRIDASVNFPEWLRSSLMQAGFLTAPEEEPLSAEEQARRGRLAAVETVRENLALAPVDGSRVIEISFVSSDPQTAADVVNAIANKYIVDQLQAKLETTRSATIWLSERVDELRQRVQDSEEAVETLRAELSLAAGQSLEITQQQLASLNASLSETRSRTAEIEGRYLRLTDALAENRDLSAESPLIREYREEESDLIARRNALSVTHPQRPRLEAQIEDIRERMREEAQRILTTVEVELAAARTQQEELESSVRELESKALDQSRQEIRLRQLEREAEASRLIYENMLSRLKETAEQESLQNADARVLSPAESPLSPISSHANMIMALAVTFGAAAGVGIIFLFDHLNNTFRVPPQIEELTGYPVLATIPAIGSRTKREEVVRNFMEKPASSLSEAIRNLRTSILFSNVDNPPKVVMFTSSIPAEGKSTTSMLAAITSRQMGKSAIIVDCDLRLPSVAKLLKREEQNKPGLLTVLEGGASYQDAIYEDPETGLHVLMARPNERRVHVNAADILSSQRFGELLKTLSEEYDLVVLDTPPAVIVTDARVMSPLVDAVVYIVRWDHTPREAVLEGLKELQSVRAPIAGIAMTMVNESKASEYYQDGYSYQKGRYKDYYTS
ncbi:GumC family protein [Amaricoccus macauensis]|uniref:GumC family protein n=1 Tax=Amaricoccus macauensis TaxID=57001 RepID=UPI003C7EA912